MSLLKRRLEIERELRATLRERGLDEPPTLNQALQKLRPAGLPLQSIRRFEKASSALAAASASAFLDELRALRV